MSPNIHAPMVRDPDTGRHCVILGVGRNLSGMPYVTVIEPSESPRTMSQIESYRVDLPRPGVAK